jgi:hypothetical protein
MKHSLLLVLILVIFPALSKGQTLRGKVIKQSGEPVQYATVYIRELKQGTTANTKGDYEIKLPAGSYTITYQSLGFQPVTENITIAGKSVVRNITLPLQYYQIPEVRISASGEDPAYAIMRKAIGMAPYYLNNISYYKAQVYLKGNLVINRIPRIMRKSLRMGASGDNASINAGAGDNSKENIMKEGDIYLMESLNEIEFTAPDKYFQRVLSYNSTFPQQGNEISPMSFIEASFYQPVIAEIAISPLSPDAFSHYKFKYLGASLQGNYTINKIAVIPKRKSQQLFEGTIYIIENLWCLHSVDLINNNLVGKIRVQQLYIPVQDNIWMPVSHKFEINISIIGFKADVGYTSSVKYTEVKPNLTLARPREISNETDFSPHAAVSSPDTVQETKTRKKIDKILGKEELNNRDMIKLSKLMEKESEASLPDSSRDNLEIKERTSQVIDKDANKKDSTYWSQIRPVPLSDIEKKSLRIRDSIQTASQLKEFRNDTIPLNGRQKKNMFIHGIKRLAFGHTWSDTTGVRFHFGGILDSRNISFNTVDGFVYGLNFRISKNWKDNKALMISPDIKWSFSRQRLLWKVNSYYKFNGLKQRQIQLRAGMTSSDISNTGSINPFLNIVTSLFFRKNYLKLYQSDYISLGYRSEIVNGLNLELRGTLESRKVLYNNTDFSFLRPPVDYTDNVPDNDYLAPGLYPLYALRTQGHGDLLAKITYTPYQKYRIYKGNKSPAGSDWPTLSITYKHGLNEYSDPEDRIKQFDMFIFEVSRDKDLGALSELKWRLRTGGFLNNRYVPFYDFFHPNSQSLPVLINNYEDAFMIPGYYSMSTPEYFGEAHIKYTTPYLLLKLLPLLSNTLMRENLSLSYFGSRYHLNYTEIGYSISEFLFIGEIGVYAGFDDTRLRTISGKIILRFN